MKIDISGGMKEDGIEVGNTFDKYGSRNPIVRWMMNGFDEALTRFVARAAPHTIHEVGCGEGHWVLKWRDQGLEARGSDFSSLVIEMARRNAAAVGLAEEHFRSRSIYDLSADEDGADLVVCCEVLEHLEDPEAGLRALARTAGRHVIVSVPREPVWRVLNMARGKYLAAWGNTPGHVQHWSRRSFVRMVSRHLQVVEVASPFPWTMILCRVEER